MSLTRALAQPRTSGESAWCELAASRLSQDIFDFGEAA